jgi:glycine hydroxymethyltransferase
MLVNVAGVSKGLTGFTAQKCLEQCGIVVDRMALPYDDRPEATSGIRLGTPIVTRNGMGQAEMERIAEMADEVLKAARAVSDSEYSINEKIASGIKNEAMTLAWKFPVR